MSQTQTKPDKRQVRGANWLLPVLVFCVLSLATYIVARWQKALHDTEREVSASFESAASTADIHERLKLHAQFLRSLQAFAVANPDPTKNLAAWKRFSGSLDISRNLPGLFIFAYAPVIKSVHASSFVESIKKQSGSNDFHIFPASTDETHAPASFIAPDGTLERKGLGFNLLSEATRREAIDTALAKQNVALSGPIVLFFDRETQRPGFLLIATIFHPGMPTNSIEERRQALAGIVVNAYRTEDFIEAIRRNASNRFSLQIFDDGGANRTLEAPPRLIFDSDPALHKDTKTPPIHHEIDFGGRNWILNFREYPHSGITETLDMPTLIMGAGLIGNTLLALLVYYLTTHRERAERYARKLTYELAQSEERFRLAASGTNDGLWDLNLETGEDYVSPRLGDIFNFTPEEAPQTSAPYLARIHPEDEKNRRKALKHHFKYNTPYDLEVRVRKKNDEWGWVRIRGEAVRTTDNRVVRMAGSISETTEKHETAAAIRAADHLKQSVLDAATEVSIIATDPKGTITVFNRGAEKMLGYFADDMIGLQTPSLIHLKSEVIARAAELTQLSGLTINGFETFTCIPQGATSEQREWTYVCKSGEHITVNLVVTAQRDMAGEITGYLGVAVDITRQKAAEAELLQHRDHLQELVAERTTRLDLALRQARAANQAKSEFLANMSHELRTPMHAILSFSELGERRTANEEHEKLNQYFRRIAQSADRLLHLIDDLLDLSKLEAGRVDLRHTPTDLRVLISDVSAHLDSLILKRDLSVSMICNLDETIASVDSKRIEQVFHNLLSNAIKFSPAGGQIQISLSAAEIAHGKRVEDHGSSPAIAVSFADSGIGIPESELETIFEKFIQSSATKTGAGGTGLGLAICREIVGQHRGTIVATNNNGSGACFTITLPINSGQEIT